jgi:hypothetical protein
MTGTINIKSWDPKYAIPYDNDYYDNRLLPFNVRPFAKIDSNPEFIKYIKNMRNGFIPVFIEGSNHYDGGWALSSVYKDANGNYGISLNTKWIGYPVDLGRLIYVTKTKSISSFTSKANIGPKPKRSITKYILVLTLILSVISIFIFK